MPLFFPAFHIKSLSLFLVGKSCYVRLCEKPCLQPTGSSLHRISGWEIQVSYIDWWVSLPLMYREAHKKFITLQFLTQCLRVYTMSH